MITFVIYYADISSSQAKSYLKQQTSQFLRDEPKYGIRIPSKDELIDLVHLSVKRVHKECRTLVLTDEKTLFHLKEDIEIKRFNLDGEKVVLSRLETLIAFLKKSSTPSNYVFLDYDMLIQKDLNPIFQESFDLAFTWRKHDFPINGGVTFIPHNRIKKGIAFHESMVSLIKEMDPPCHYWGGSQRALFQLAKPERFERDETAFHLKINETDLLLLPCDLYNYTLYPSNNGLLKEYPDKYILHFKGNKKLFMPSYWEKYLHAKLSSPPGDNQQT